jgi:alkylated DNA repair dioxygenase AlkB
MGIIGFLSVMQLPLFNNNPEEIIFPLPNADIRFYPTFFTAQEAKEYLENLLDEASWKEEEITLFGKKVMQPRMVSWHGNPEAVLRYSGIEMHPNTFTPTLELIKNRLESFFDIHFNGVLCNLYRNGKDSMGWHSDDEKELGKSPL